MVEGIIDRIRKEVRLDPLVIATGGLARTIAAETQKIHVIDENLTLEGLRIIYERNLPDPVKPRSAEHTPLRDGQ